MQKTNLFYATWVRLNRFLPHLRIAILLSTILPIIPLNIIILINYDDHSFLILETFQLSAFLVYCTLKKRHIGAITFSAVLLLSFTHPTLRPGWSWCLVFAVAIDLLVSKHTKLAFFQFFILYIAQLAAGYPASTTTISVLFSALVCSSASILIRDAGERLEKMQREAERSKEVAAELIQQLRRDIADSLHDDLAADLTRMLIISRSIRLPHGDDRDRMLDLQDRTQQALTHLRLLIHNLAVSKGPPKEEPTLQEIVEPSASTLAQREIVLDADLDGIERIPALHRSEPGRLLVAFIRENTLNALKYNSPHDLVSLFVEQERDTLFISCSSPWREQKVPEEMHGGYGLLALQDRFENAGGSLSSNRIGTSWTVLASLPWSETAIPATNARSLISPPDGVAYA